MRRLWQPCSRRPAADVPAGAHKIRMVTYNILADKYSRCGWCSGSCCNNETWGSDACNSSLHVMRCMLMHMRMGALAHHKQKQQCSSGTTCRAAANKQASAKEHAAVHAGLQQPITRGLECTSLLMLCML
jgi:hypothetical protein